MNRSSLVRALFAFLVLAASTYVVLTARPELGLDLRGGTQIVLETSDSPTVKADQNSTDKALEVLRRRIDALGVTEPSVTRQGERRIIVELPGVQDPREAAEVIGKTAQLSFHEVLDQVAAKPAKPAAGDLYLPSDDGGVLKLGKPAMTGDMVGGAEAVLDTQQMAQGWIVQLNFKDDGGKIWSQITGKAACQPVGAPQRSVAIVLDNEVLTAPQVDPTGGSTLCNVGLPGSNSTITGNFTEEQAKDLSALISGGALPLPVDIIDQRTVGPSLGKDAIQASAWAGVIGVALTALFIVLVYRLVGLMAVIGLLAYAGMSYAALTVIGATLTLPGLAGFVLAIGMAVDANVLVFERAREDYIAGRTDGLRRSLRSGFGNALSAIADSNITTLLAAGLLFFLAAGPVRGFGVTLSVGVIASMLSALVVTRVFAEFFVSRKFVLNRPSISGIAGHGRVRTWLEAKQPALMKHSRRWLLITLAAIVISVAGVAIRGLNLGIEFTGGRLIEVSTTQPVSPDQARAAVAEAGYPNAVVQASGTDDITVRTGTISNDEAEKIRESIGRIGGGSEVIRNESIGPSLGNELRNKALIALGVALLAQLAYLAIRFRWTFGAGAVLALLQNVAVVVGVFAWTGKPVDGIFLAAMLTIIGYTVNDSVVVFDRIRETRNARSTENLGPVIDTAIVNVLPRTINTGISTLFILAALLFLGGDSLADFALALLLGIVVGTYSSNLTAAPLLVELEKRYPAPPPRPKRVQQDRDAAPDRGAVV
ncbi:protein-export membrane protein SecD [Kribbella flavida DSM 17836]|uniref:Multifunctional fusion protein n=1 Tax=Kribbella flavida (strain DSM 17836 / JCM 10339 / NBRC 14399) TaxID=479435 RepID=D2PZB5_KRIFD|nr:protein translocase subunit SecD [Kribbella flavida]ADB33724.1 protein-export membrane protein SecD [Kribbella flavida DSM 17836]